MYSQSKIFFVDNILLINENSLECGLSYKEEKFGVTMKNGRIGQCRFFKPSFTSFPRKKPNKNLSVFNVNQHASRGGEKDVGCKQTCLNHS